jgi:DHA2 family multidrug resistance protein-like MFS transporter
VIQRNAQQSRDQLQSPAVAPIAGRLADRHSPGLLGAIGMGLFCLGLVVLSLTEGAPGIASMSARLMLCGAGFALFQSPNNRAMLTAAPPARAGAAGGMLSTARLLGQSLGAALAAVTLADAAAAGAGQGLLLAAVLAGCAAVVSGLRIGRQRPAA